MAFFHLNLLGDGSCCLCRPRCQVSMFSKKRTHKPRLYLAGPINGCTDEECSTWRNKVIEALSDLYEIHDPFVRDYRGFEKQSYDEIVEQDLAELVECDAILANCFKPSAGTSGEIVYAYFFGLQVVSVASASPWVMYHSDKCCQDLDEAIAYLRSNVVSKKSILSLLRSIGGKTINC
jgi:nucleoside 2-deoxyribosyltransferase